jgi:cyclopropane fatty-acyl-phospholipid synthase-like methyltransferase
MLNFGERWNPTPMNVVDRMLELADIQNRDVLYDIGSGDGRILIMAAKKYDIKTFGIEVDPIRVLWSRLRVSFQGLNDRVKVIWGNFHDIEISKATVVTIYQSTSVNETLLEKFKHELRPGTKIVSYYFSFLGWKPYKIDEEKRVYLYKIA